MDTTPEKRMKFAEVIIRKCDEVSALTNDLFLHALSDMDKLEMNMHEVNLCAFMRKAVAELISDMDRDRKSTRLNSSHNVASRMPSSA